MNNEISLLIISPCIGNLIKLRSTRKAAKVWNMSRATKDVHVLDSALVKMELLLEK